MIEERKYALASMIAAVAMLLQGCGAATAQSGAASATPRAAVAAAVTDYLVPVSGMALVEGQSSIYDYPVKVTVNVIDACLKARGMPRLPDQPGPPLAGALQFPNLGYIKAARSFGFGTVVKASDPTRGMTLKAKHAYSRAVSRCDPRVRASPVSVGLGQRLFGEWLKEALNLVSTAPEVREANRAGEICSRGTRFRASSYEDEETEVGNAATAYYVRGRAVLGRRIERDGADIFLRCFAGAVEAADTALRTRSRVFLKEHATAIRVVENEAWRQVRLLEARYHVLFDGLAASVGR